MQQVSNHYSEESFLRAARQASTQSRHPIQLTGYCRYNEAWVAARFALPNGLTIVFMPEHSAEIFAYQTWFKVGSKNEHPTRTGLAHLFEHLMFKSTTLHPAGEFDREMERRGSQTNAATWVDWTHYSEALAARGDNLETVIHFEADRMTGLVLDAETFASELEVVKNERRMSVDDSVMGLLSERLSALAYRVHPYRWPTIGSMEHLQVTQLSDLRAFYRAYYAPNNATIVVAGDLDAATVLALIAAAYGDFPAQPIVHLPRESEPPQTASRLEMIQRAAVVTPQILAAYHIPGERHADFPALQMLAEILTAGDGARLYKSLVTEQELATDVGGMVTPFAEPGLFEFALTLRADAPVREALASLQEELDAVATHGVEAEEHTKAKNSLELAFYEGLKGVEGCAELLGHFQTNEGDFSLAFTEASRYDKVSMQQLQRVAGETFCHTNRSAVIAQQGGTAS